MIEVKYKQRFGNNLFQYCFGRILAEELDFELKAEPIEGFPHTYKRIRGKDYSAYSVQRLTGQVKDIQPIIEDRSKRKIVLDGYFQKYNHYKKYKKRIHDDWLITKPAIQFLPNTKDVMLCIRRGDYVPKHALPFSYYEEALSLMTHRKIYICTDDVHDPFITFFQWKYHAIVLPTNPLSNLEFIKRFSKIIISNSTFCWWAAFLSNAEEIYMPIPMRGFWSSDYQINLQIPDDPRYHSLHCREIYQESTTEKILKMARKSFHLPI